MNNFRISEKNISFSVIALVVIIGSLSLHKLTGVQLGSNTFVQAFPYTVFPAEDEDNAILNFAFLNNGFGLEDNSTHCIFSSLFPVGGVIALNEGVLFLNHDFSFDTNATYTSYGKISGNGNNVYFASTMDEFGNPNQEAVFENVVVSLCAEVSLQGAIRFTGDYCVIDGYKNKLIFEENGKIIVDDGTTLVLKNLDIQGFSAYALQCVSNNSTVILENVQIYQSDDYMFENGSLEIKGVCQITPFNTYSLFTYRSPQALTIHTNSSLRFSSQNCVFTYDPMGGDRNLLVFEDRSSSLILDQAELHVTTTGIELTGGTLLVVGNSIISSEHSQEMVITDSINGSTSEVTCGFGVQLGNGNSDDDMRCCIKGNVQLKVRDGSWLTFNNGNPTTMVMGNVFSSLYIGPYAILNLKTSLELNQGTLYLDENSRVYSSDQVSIIGNTQVIRSENSGF